MYKFEITNRYRKIVEATCNDFESARMMSHFLETSDQVSQFTLTGPEGVFWKNCGFGNRSWEIFTKLKSSL